MIGLSFIALAVAAQFPVTNWNRVSLIIVEQEARRGNKDAQYELGRRYEEGLGVGRDISAAIQLYRSASKRQRQVDVHVAGFGAHPAGRVATVQEAKVDVSKKAANRLAVICARRNPCK
ncbi:TPR repeat protein [Sphingomonas jinjuensis]|uniref:TPR repeat protein n=1 Tax=Sphingomonas jinjuensis TaxID=535907 RepID=A0A840FLD5_9SPHN|nr:SEL1-like repeat protein [Sphingomonas jinjuensis]MBB4154125.1 TPR repeat protein [Sphingomonas jinjuensis]